MYKIKNINQRTHPPFELVIDMENRENTKKIKEDLISKDIVFYICYPPGRHSLWQTQFPKLEKVCRYTLSYRD